MWSPNDERLRADQDSPGDTVGGCWRQAIAHWGPREPGPLFLAIWKAGQAQTGGLSPEALGQMLDRRASAAKVKSLSWHDMRRTVAGDLLDEGTDIATVARVLGHASVQTTARYDRRDARAVQKALQARHVPYRRRS